MATARCRLEGRAAGRGNAAFPSRGVIARPALGAGLRVTDWRALFSVSQEKNSKTASWRAKTAVPSQPTPAHRIRSSASLPLASAHARECKSGCEADQREHGQHREHVLVSLGTR